MKAESLYIQKLTYDENTGNEIIGLFPLEANPAIVSSYTYDAKRMGGAPTITATIYSSEPLQWKKEEFVEYNGDRYFASYTPNSTKDNTSRMWKSEITFTSRRELLDNTLFFDVVVDDVDTQNKDRYRSNQTKFTFGGTIHEFVARINSSMAYCGLYRPTEEYKGYYVVVDKGYGTDEVKEVSFEDQYLTDVLQLINTTFELDYYWDGNVCHVGKVQHDLTDTPIKYGSSDALISVSKENANYKIVDMITGYGSSDNLPYYYPNDDEFGEAVFNTENISKDKVSVDLSKFLKGLKYNDVLVLYKSKYGQKYSASIDSSLFGLTRNTEPENLTLADSQTNPTVTCSFGFSFYVKLIKGQILDFTKLSFKFGMLDSLTHKNNITEITAAYKDIYLSNGNDIITITKKTVFGDNCKYPCENDGEYKLTIWAEFSYRCRVFRNGNGVTDYYGANSWNASFIGNIELLYEPTSEYEWKNGDKYIPYGESGINVSEIGEANCIEYDYQFVKDGDRYGFNKVYTGTEDNAVKVIVTDRVWIAPSSVLMPSIYRNTKGAERFYYALNNTHKLPSGNGYYEFVNLYKKGNPHQGTVTFDDIKPTINGIVNAEGQLFGEIADVAFDKEDSDVKDSDGKYIHNYFYIKLHKFNGDFGFDLFAHALASESAKINLIKSNGCPACSFTIDCYWNSTKNKCYNNVLTDGNGNLRSDSGKMNSKGDYILNDTYVEDNKSNQDSTKEELWIAVQKDTSTLGIVMPNASAGFKPQKGDLFVITGIKPPKVLVTAAEKRLDDALIKHMSENNTDQFNYSVKFSRIFLQENPDFASKLNEKAKLSIQIQGDFGSDGNLISHEVFVSNYSVKVDNDELAEVEIELVNSLEVTKSDTKQIIDAVKGEAVKSLSSMVGGSNTNSFNASITDKMYLSKLNDDIAKGTITWEKIQKLLSGLVVGNFNNENGGSWTPDTEGRSHLITDYLEVRMKAIFEELVVKKTSTIGGKEIISPAGGVVAHKVEEVTVTYNNVSQKAYRCYFLAEQEGDAVDNDFAIGDQVRSESFNVRKGTYHKVGNHFYWRLVIGRDEEPVELEGKKYHYIDLSDTDCATVSDVPAKGDVLSQCGNRTDVERQNCLIFSAVDTYSPSISLYHGINSYSFANREYVQYGVNKQTNKAFFNVYGDMYVGDRPTKENGYEGSSYIKYDSATKQVSVKGKISAKSTVDGKELSQYIKENSAKGLTEEQVNNLIKNSQVITDLQNQVDGAIETWFYEGVPTLNNAPASSWTTDKDKDTHLGDLYYDNKTGKAYRFAKDGNTYKWTIITDTDIAKALSDASKAQETADGKMKVFSTQPIPPYQLGDIWVNATYPTDGSIYKNEILRCQTAKAKGSSFAIADWTKASKYTDDSALNTFKEEYKNDMASYKEQLDEKVETWFYNYAPTTQNKPASDWTTDTLKSQHAGDLFYNTSNGYTYRWTGTAWARIKDNDINTAMTAASKAQDTADGKRTVFTSQPTVPYDEGDLWASGGDDGKTLMVCVKNRDTGSFTSSEWVKANDSDLNAFAKTIEESLNGIRDQLDKKAETWYQSTDPSASWTTDDAKKEHKGDLWYNTSNNQTFFWNGAKWDKQDVPTEVFDKIDGKSSIYVSKPASYEERDLWILEAAYTLGGVAYSKGELVVATKTNASFSAADWTKKVKYTDDTVANAAKKAAEEAKKAADTAQTNVTNLGKTVTSNKKAFDNYVTDGYLEPSEIAAMAQDSKRLEDAFAAAEKSYTEVKEAAVLKDTKELTDLNTAFVTLSTAKTELIKYLSDISARYNAANTEGKATIVSAVGTKFTNFQSAYSAFYDKLGLANAYITSKIYSNLGVVIGDVTSLAYLKKALMDAPDTEINGGLILTSLIGLRDTDGNTTAGINGITEKSAKGGGIAAWFGGEMVDKDYNDGSKTPANTIFRFDGSGYVAGGAIWWGTDGRVHADPTSFVISEKNLGAYLTFFEPTWKEGSAGTSVADLVSLKPNAPFSKLGVSGDATFEGAISFHGIKLTYDSTNKAIKIDGNLYATGGITAYGAGASTTGGGGLNASVISYARIIEGSYTDADLTSIPNAYAIKALSSRIDNIATELGGLSLSWNNITGKPSTFTPSAHTHKWTEITDRITKVSQLTNDKGYLTSHQSLAAYLKSADAEKTYSKLGHTHAFSEITGKPTTLAGYGVTDGVNAVSVTGNGNAVTSASIDGHTLTLTKGSTFSLSGHTHTFASLTSKPTTIAGYGITDAYTKAQVNSTIAKYLPLAGGTITGVLTVNGIATFKSKVAIGDIYIINDGSGNLYVQKTDGKTAANFYATGGITAFGASSVSGGTGSGLNGSVLGFEKATAMTSADNGDSSKTEVSFLATAWSIKQLNDKINAFGTGVFSDYLTIAAAKATYQPKGSYLTSHQTIYGLTIQKNGTSLGTYTPNSAAKTINVTVPTKLSELSNDSGYTKNTGTVTSVAISVPTGLSVSGSPITTNGTIAIALASGYSIPTTAKQTAWDGAVSAKHTHSNKSVLDGISSTKVSHWNSAYDWYALMTTDEETADGIINKWNEVVSFLANIAQTDTLSGIVDGINKSISDEVARAKKAEGVNASGISANKGSIATLQGYFTNGSAKKALQLTNARKLWGNSFNGTADINGSIIVPSGKYISIGNIKLEYDAANKALKITNTTTEEVANLYTSGGVSAYGVGASSSSGGGLNGSVKAYADAIRLTTENLSEIASAYSVAKLYSEIQNVASAVPSISVSVPTGGNALTGATYDASTGTITFTKGTFLTAHQSLDSYVNEIAVSGTGNAITAVSKSGKKVTFTKGATYLTAHQSLAAYATQNWVKNEATAHNADMVDNYHASGLFTGFSISDVENKVTISIGGTSKALNLVRAFPSGVGNNFNDIATHGNSMGMSNIAAPYASSTANYQTLNGYVNPNGQTGWHHYINLSYTDSNNTATSPNMWQTQFAIKAGTTEVYVRSRAGGKISNDAAWAAPWVRLARVTDNVASASKVANALSWSGYSSGSYNGSAAKSISIPNNTNQLTNGAGFITASASISGNAGSATKLQNSRTINGTSFNGTANIVTSYWGTTRKLWGNSVNGNADVNGSITIANTDGVYVQIGDVRLVYDKANTAIKVVKSDGTTAANFYATGGITAYGEGSGSSGGGGLNASVISYARIIEGSYTDADLTSIPNAYAIKALSSRIDNIATELGGLSLSWNNITGKPSTFTPSAHTHKWTEITDRITKVSQLTNDKGYLTSHQSLAAYLKSADAEKTYSKLGHTHAFSEITGKPTTLAGYGVTDGVNAVSVTGNGNAVTSASIDGHTLTLTKGSTFSLSGHTHTFASLTSKPTTIAGYGITDAYTKAQVNSTIAKYLPLAGGTITGVLTVNGIATFKSKVAIGDIYIINDGSGNLYVQKTDGKTAANFYATGGITAFGASSVSGGTGSGLNGSVLGFEKATAMTSADNGDSSKTEVSFLATAWSIKQLNDKINAFGTGVFSDYLTIAAAKATYQPKGSYLTSHQTIYGLTIQKNGTSLGTYTPNSAAKTINVTVPTKLSELSNDSGYTKNTGTVTSVAISVPTGLSVSGSPITTNGTIAIALASGYSIPTTAKQTAWDGAVSAKHTHSNKSVLDGISSTKVSHWNSAYDWYALMTTDEETADGIINKWNEVVSFLANIAQTDTLSGIVDGINKSISDEVARAKKAEGVNASGISANKGSIATLQGYFTNGSAKKALQLTNARKLWGNSFNGTADINGSIIVPSGKYISIGNIKLEYDAANKALKITNTTTEEVANLYTSGGVSAYGVGASSSSGGGLNGSVKAYADAIRLTTENLSEIASAYSVAKLYSEIQNVASAVPSISVSVPTGGNALTGATYDASTGTITFTKGTFLTAHQSLDSYVNEIAVSGTGNAITAVSKSGKKVTFTKGATYLTAHQSLAAYATQNWVKNEATAHNADMVDNYHASGLFTGFSISDVENKVTISIGGTSKALNLVRAFPSGVGNNFNDIATHGNSMGMSNIAAPYASSTANYQTLNGYVNPNGQTGWHHYINLSYTDSNNTATSPNMWQTQFAIKAGTTEVYVRSRAGGKISNDAAWAAPWVRLARVTDNVASASKVANALSWSGYSSGSYNGSAAKSISIPNNTNQLTNGAGFITASASISGNAGSATKLQNSRTINGTSFNGTANIVTSYWGTTRKLWGNSVNGNADVNGSITIANTDGVYVQIGDVRLVYDKANTAIKVVKSDGTTAANFYATGGITAYGEGSGSSGGGGLNGSVKSYSDALKLTSESLSEIASAYSIKQLSTRITSLEGGSATSISVSGSGNAVTSITKNGTTITVTKGATFLTAHQSLSAYMKTADAKSLFLYHTRENIVTDLDNFNTKGASHIYEMIDVTNKPTDNGWLQVMNWGSADANYGMLLANDYSINGSLYFRHKVAGKWNAWKTLIDSSNIANQSVKYATTAGTAKNPNALSWSGYASGSYDGSVAKSISIPNNTNQLTNGAGFITASASITGNAATATKVNHSLSVFGKSFNGSADVTVADTDLIASISTATANLTDKTEILTSYASDNGFNDSNAKNRIYRRPASAIWGYINSKTISNADKLDNVHLNGIFTALSNTNNGVSMTIGTVAKSLANMQVYSATKLATARNIALGHDFRGSANFDGTGNITINGHINAAIISLGPTDPSPFKRIAHVQVSGSWNDNVLLLYLSQGYIGGYFGICRVEFGTNDVSEAGSASASVKWLFRHGYATDYVQVGFYSAKHNSYMDVFVKTTGGYQGTVIRCLQDSRGSINSNVSLLKATATTEAYTSIEAAATALYKLAYTAIVKGSDAGAVNYANSAGNAGTLDGIHANGLFTNLSNNGNNLSITIGGTNKTLTVGYATKAAQLNTARTLWGQSFDGTGNVNGALSGATTISASNTISTTLQNGALKIGNKSTPISAIDEQVIFNTGGAIRFGETAWDWNQWAGLKYNHSSKTIYLGIADGSVFNANSAQSGGKLKLINCGLDVPDNIATSGILTVGKNIRLVNMATNVSALFAQLNGESLSIGYGSRMYATTQMWCNKFAIYCNEDIILLNIDKVTATFKTNILATGGVTAYASSDARLKTDLRKLDYLGIIKAMGGTFGFAWKKDNTRSIGWIAQHVLCNPHLKDIVETDEKGYYKINYWSPKLIATAFGAIEQVGDEVSRLKARVVFLESEVQRLSGKQDGNNKKRD